MAQHGMTNNQMPGQPAQYQPVQPMGIQQGGAPKPWNNGLFGCFSDLGTCCMTCCCPCVQYGQNYEAIHKQGCFSNGAIFTILAYCGLSCLVHKDLRRDIRQRHGLEEGCGDCLTTCCCPVCAICQEAREIKSRGGH